MLSIDGQVRVSKREPSIESPGEFEFEGPMSDRISKTFAVCCYFVLWVCAGNGCFQLTPITSYSANYPDKWFQGGVKEGSTVKFWTFVTGGEDGERLADVFLRFSDQSVVRLQEISEDTAKAWALRFSDRAASEIKGAVNNPYTMYDIDERSMLAFRRGKLIWCTIAPKPNDASTPFKDVEIGPTSDGPFLALPVGQKDLERVFGKPETIKKIKQQQPH